VTSPGDDVAGALIGALADEGEHVDDGGFTLDRAAALAKLRDYQLKNPHEYLLILVEAAWAAEASDTTRSAKIECRSDTYVDFRGPTLEPAALLDLFAAVFASTQSLDGEALRRARVLQLIGLAINNALALDIDAVTVDAYDPSGAPVRLHVSPRAALTLVDERPEPALAPGWIRVQVHAQAGLARGLTERALLTARCRHASFAIRVDGSLVSKQSLTHLSGRKRIILDGRKVGEAGYRTPGVPAEILVINRGVEIPLPAPGMPETMHAIVHADLPMDLSRSQLVEGPELEQIRAALRVVRGRLGQPPKQYSQPQSKLSSEAKIGWAIVIGFALIGALFPMLTQSCAREPAPAAAPATP
jgi:hypothetical protein